MLDWPTIDSAPQDGTRIWAVNDCMDYPVIAEWRDYDFMGRTTKQWVCVADPHERWQPLTGNMVVPTRWNPLPGPFTPSPPLPARKRPMCDCVNQMNALLAEKNGRLESVLGFGNGGMSSHLHIGIEKINKRGQRPPCVIPTYCPFCGEKADVTTASKGGADDENV